MPVVKNSSVDSIYTNTHSALNLREMKKIINKYNKVPTLQPSKT